jgi:hypothetical protein
MTKREENWFDRRNNDINNVEGSVINLLSAIAPWLAPLIPAYMSFVHANDPKILNFPIWVALAVAIVVEVLGLATVSTAIKFWKYNQRYQKASAYKKAPVEIALFSFVFYISMVLLSNVAIDACNFFFPTWTNGAIILVRVFYTLLTIPAALIVSIRQQHKNMLEEIVVSGVPKSSSSSSTKHGSSNGIPRNKENKDAVYAYMDRVYASETRIPSFTDVRNELHLPQSSASRIRNEWLKEKQENVK